MRKITIVAEYPEPMRRAGAIVFFLAVSLLANSCSTGWITSNSSRTPSGENCQAIDTFGQSALIDGTLTPFWAQEYIGSDLALQSLAEVHESKPVRVAVIDKDFAVNGLTGKKALLDGSGPSSASKSGLHGNLVTNLINGLPPVGVSQNAEIVALATSDITTDYMNVARSVLRSRPMIVNLSKSFFDSSAVVQPLLKMASAAILVISSGNEYPDRPMERSKKTARAVLVGNLNADGLISKDSNESAEVTIAAPSDRLIQSTSNGKDFEDFGGTSGAAPLAAGALANVISVLGEITLDESKVLLRRTAVPTVNIMQEPQLNGAGMLNALKLVRVAQRLKALGWPTNRQKLLETSSVWDFSSEAADELAKGKASLGSETCKKQGLRHLRASFLLDPRSEEARRALEVTYRQLGFSKNATFYSNLSQEGLRASIRAGLHEQELSQSILRTLQAIGPLAVPLVRELSQSTTPVDQEHAWIAATCLGNGALDLVNTGASNTSSRIRQSVITDVWRLSDLALPILRQTVTDPDRDVRITSVVSAARLGDPGSDLLIQAFKDSDVQVRINVVYQSGNLGLGAGQILRMALKDTNPEVRSMGVDYISRQNDLSLLEDALRNVDPDVRLAAISQAQVLQVKGFDALRLLSLLSNDPDPRIQAALKKMGIPKE